MIGLKKRYTDVARKLSLGLSDGTITMESELGDEGLSLFAAFLFQYLAPQRVAFALGASSGVATIDSNTQVMIQFDPRHYESMPEEVKVAFYKHVQELVKKGARIEAKNLNGKPMDLLGHLSLRHPQ